MTAVAMQWTWDGFIDVLKIDAINALHMLILWLTYELSHPCVSEHRHGHTQEMDLRFYNAFPVYRLLNTHSGTDG